MKKSGLVRDRTLEEMKKDGMSVVVDILKGENYVARLIEAWNDEVTSLQTCKKGERKRKAAEVLELTRALLKYFDLDLKEIEDLRIAVKKRRGGFVRRLFIPATPSQLSEK